MPYGIIAGGLVEGTVNLWNPAKITGSKAGDAEKAVVAKLSPHNGPVWGLEFNALSPNLLATGAEDGELRIWDLVNPATPSAYPQLKGASPLGELSYLSWNPKVQHILASASFNGSTVVWDLRKQKQVISFSDPVSRRRCSCLQWNPEVATQLIVASDDDRSPTLQVWDLRNAMSPVGELAGHTKGVLAMAWCPNDSGLLLTTSKDNRTICWDVQAGEVHCDLPSGDNWNFDVQWCSRVPGVLSASSFDGQVSLFNIESAAKQPPSDSGFGVPLASDHLSAKAFTRAPNWLKPPCGASFGFGGKLVSFNQKNREIQLSSIITDEGAAERAAQFDAAVAGADRESLKSLCQAKAADSSTDPDRQIWSFLEVLFEDDARQKLLALLDFQQPSQEQEEREEGEQLPQAELDQSLNGLQLTSDAVGGGEDFFEHYAEQEAASKAAASVNGLPSASKELEEEAAEEEGEAAAVELAVQRALIVGDYESAVKHCRNANRAADALVLASIGGSELWSETQKWYLTRRSKRHGYLQLLRSIVDGDLRSLVHSRPVAKWRDTLAAICTYAPAEDWSPLCLELAQKLLASGDSPSAVLCFMCAGSADQAMDIWASAAEETAAATVHSSSQVAVLHAIPPASLQDIVEKCVVLGLSSPQPHISGPSAVRLAATYAELMAAQGQLPAALTCLKLVPDEGVPAGVLQLKDRLFRGQAAAPAGVSPPPFPFEFCDAPVTAAPNAAAAEATAAPASLYPSSHGQSAAAAAAAPVAASFGGAAQPSYQPSAYQPTPPAAQAPPVAPAPASLFVPSTQYSAVPQQPQQYPTAPPPATTPSLSSYSATPAYPPAPTAPPPPPSAPPASAPFQPQKPPAGFFVPHQSAPPHPPPPGAAGQPPSQFMPAPPQQAAAQPPPPPSSFVPKAPPALPHYSHHGPPPSAPPTLQGPMGGPPPPTGGPPSYPGQQEGPHAPKPAFVPLPPPALPTMPQQPSPQFSHQQFPQHPQQQPTMAPPTGPPPMAGPSHFAGSGPVTLPPAAAAPLAAPPAPPPTVETADTSNVSDDLKPVVVSLTRLFHQSSEAMGGPNANPIRRREIDANSKKIGSLFAKLNAGQVSPPVAALLCQLCQAVDARDYGRGMQAQVALTTSHWDECSFWLSALKSTIKTLQSVRA